MLSVSRIAAYYRFFRSYNSPFIMNNEHVGRAPAALRWCPNEVRTVSKTAAARFFVVIPVSVAGSAGVGFAASASSNEDTTSTARSASSPGGSSAARAARGWGRRSPWQNAASWRFQPQRADQLFSISSPGGSHSCRELIQTQRSATKKTPLPKPLASGKETLCNRCGRLVLLQFSSHDIRVSSARCRIQSVERGDRPYWANDATKWRQWSVSITANLRELRSRMLLVEDARSVVWGAADWDCRLSSILAKTQVSQHPCDV